MTEACCSAFRAMHARLKAEHDEQEALLSVLMDEVYAKKQRVKAASLLLGVLAEMAWIHWDDQDNDPETLEVMEKLVSDCRVSL